MVRREKVPDGSLITFNRPQPDSVITNGFNLAQVLPAFIGRIGWRQPTLAGSPVLDGSNAYSSPAYFTGEDKAFTVGAAGGPVDGQTAFATASLDGYTYNLELRGIGTLVRGTEWDYVDGGGFKLMLAVFKADQIYIAHITSTPVGIVPTEPPVSGRVYQDFHPAITVQKIKDAQEDPAITDEEFNDLLRNMDQQVVLTCLNAIFNRPQLIEHALVFDRYYDLVEQPISNAGKFCGYRIRMAPGDFAARLESVSLYFDSAATFKLYLFNDLQKAPINSVNVTTQTESQVVQPLGWLLSRDAAHQGGVFYLGYFQNDLEAAKAIDIEYITPNRMSVLGISPFEADAKGAADFDRILPAPQYFSYGMNAEISSFKDYSQTIARNAGLFDEARGLAMAILVIEKIKQSSRINSNERVSKADVQQLDVDMNLAFPTQDFPFVAGLKAQLQREFKRLNATFFPKPGAMSVPLGGDREYNPYQYLNATGRFGYAPFNP